MIITNWSPFLTPTKPFANRLQKMIILILTLVRIDYSSWLLDTRRGANQAMQSTLFNQSVAHPTACWDRRGCLAHSIKLERSVRPRTTCAAQVTGPSLVCSAQPSFAKSYQAEPVDCLQQEDSPEQANVCPTCGIDNASRPRGYMCAYHQFYSFYYGFQGTVHGTGATERDELQEV